MRERLLPALAAAFTLAVLAAAPAASASTIQVCAACTHPTIQSAVTDAHAGDLIAVDPGTYPDPVFVPSGLDGLTIAGARGGHPADVPRGGSESTVDVQNTLAFAIESSNVTIDGLSITGGGPGIF